MWQAPVRRTSEAYRELIELELSRGRNAMGIWEDHPDFSRVVSFSWLMWFEGSAGYFVVRILVAGRCLLLSCRLG